MIPESNQSRAQFQAEIMVDFFFYWLHVLLKDIIQVFPFKVVKDCKAFFVSFFLSVTWWREPFGLKLICGQTGRRLRDQETKIYQGHPPIPRNLWSITYNLSDEKTTNY